MEGGQSADAEVRPNELVQLVTFLVETLGIYLSMAEDKRKRGEIIMTC